MENRGRKLSEPSRRRIRKLLEEGMSVRNIARAVQVAASTVQKVRSEAQGAAKCGEICSGAAADISTSTPAKICRLTKRTQSQVNASARREPGRVQPATPKTKARRRRAYVSLPREMEFCLLTKRTQSKLNDAAMIEKPPDGGSTFRLGLENHPSHKPRFGAGSAIIRE